MKKITPEETSLIYLFPEDPHPLENEIISEHIIKRSSMNTTSDLEKLIDYSITRVILVDNPIRRNEFILYYLHWDNGLDLCSLDNLIKEDNFTDQDFANSIKTFISEITCPSCKNRYVALVVPTGDAYISAPELLDEKIKRRKYYSCPNCSMSLKQLAVKILSKA
jgi:hypothetical protein